ncbi:hypothetical protein Tco_0276392 [Tanacetum coccineum]
MPHKTAEDHQNTKSYIPKIFNEYTLPLKRNFEFLENHCIHEGRVVYPNFDDLVYVRSMFKHIRFDCLLDINEQIVPCFILEFYSQYRVNYTLEGQMLIEFVIQDQFFSYTLDEFGQILGGNRDHVPTCICHMIYCIARSERYNLAYFIAKQMEFVTKQPPSILPYGMLLTQLFKYVMFECLELSNGHYDLYDRATYPLTAQQERKTRKDSGTRRGRSSTSSSSTFGQPSSSHPNDDDNDENDEGTSRASTPSLTCFVNSLSNEIPQNFSNPPNVDLNMETFYSRQTEILNRQVQLQDEQRGGIMSIEKGVKNLFRGKKKK